MKRGLCNRLSLFLNIFVSRRGVVVLLQASEQKVCSLKLYRSTVGICQEGVLRCSSKKSGSKASVEVADIH